jgi:ribonucleotide reductase beta subunit family protein with ferritin-like domain
MEIEDNIDDRWSKEFNTIPELSSFYKHKNQQEQVHTETYQLIVDKYYGSDRNEIDRIYKEMMNSSAIRPKLDIIGKYVRSDTPLSIAMFSEALIEGPMFQSAFATIHKVTKYGSLPGLEQANTFISRDEGLHTTVDAHLVKEYLSDSSLRSRYKEMMYSVMDTERKFIESNNLCLGDLELEPKKINQDSQFWMDETLVLCGFPKEYNVSNPFPDMDFYSAKTMPRQFEVKQTVYTFEAYDAKGFEGSLNTEDF